MDYAELSCREFADRTFSGAPAPGGGSVASLVGALGAALGGMVCNLTSGKRKYAQYEADIRHIRKEAETLTVSLMDRIDQDAKNFLPLSRAYGLPTATEEERKYKEKAMQEGLKKATQVPMDIVRISYQAIKLHEELVDKVSSLAVSDVGCGILCLKSALMCGWLNVAVNLNGILDQEFVASVKRELEPILEDGQRICDEVYGKVLHIFSVDGFISA